MTVIKVSEKNLKIAGATTLALFSLVTVFTATIAWFVLNNSIKANGITIRAENETGRLNTIEIYEFDKTIDKSGVSNYSFYDEPSATIYGGTNLGDQYFLMGDYNPLSTEHPILILFTLKTDYLSTEAGDMYIKGLTTAVDFLGATENGTPKYTLGPTSPLARGTKTVEIDGQTKTVDCYPLSSAVNFKCAAYSSSAFSTLLTNSTTDRIDIPANSIALKESFVNFASSGAGITFKKNPTIYSSPGGNTSIQYIAMVVNYDGNAISAIYSTYLGNTTLETTYGGRLYFTCDWTLEVF